MNGVVFRSEDLPAADRFTWWNEMASQSLVRTLVRSDHEDDFRATLGLLDLGPMQVSWLTCPPLRMQRTAQLIRQSDPETYFLSLVRRGAAEITQGGRETAVGPRELVLYDSSRPFRGQVLADDAGIVEGTVIQVPGTLLPLPADKLTRLTATRIPAQDGMGAILRGYLEELTQHTADYTMTDMTRLAAITLDLLAVVCAHYLEAEALLPSETHRQALQARIHAFIQQNLGDPTLCAESIAAAHQISIRHLYQLFQDQGLGVAAYIRQRRLERCRHDLADPRMRSRPIHAIAARWGFASGSHFSRLFRTAYGVSPADYRGQADHGVRESTTALREPLMIS